MTVQSMPPNPGMAAATRSCLRKLEAWLAKQYPTTEGPHAQRPGPLRHAEIGTVERAQRDHLAGKGGVGVEVERRPAQLRGHVRQDAEKVRVFDAARLSQASAQLGARAS